MDIREKWNEFRALEKRLHAVHHVLNLLYLDAVTAAPSDTAAGRGETMTYFNRDVYDLIAGSKTRELIAALSEGRAELTEVEAREIEVFSRDLDYVACIPRAEYVENQLMINEAESVWHKAKAENDFPAFAPYLEKIVENTKRFSRYYCSERDPYDVCLDQFEKGLNRATADVFFASLREKIVPLLSETQSVAQPENRFLFKHYPIEGQKALAHNLMSVLTIDPTHCTLAETEHPFTLDFNRNDVRITTHYLENNLTSSMYSVIHEGGHALYELGSGEEYERTSLAGGVSMGIHESQSRLFENILGRSREFLSFLYPTVCRLFPEQLSGIDTEAFYRAVNRAESSLIRTEADELTYPLHIMVRYELEKALMDGTLAVRDLPEAWNAKMLEYLGIPVPDDRRGVLQDSHWSGGSIGYFPSYALGSAYSAQMMVAMQRELDTSALLSRGELAPIVGWLGEHLYRHGRRYEPSELLKRVCGAPFDPVFYTDYLSEKFRDVYHLS